MEESNRKNRIGGITDSSHSNELVYADVVWKYNLLNAYKWIYDELVEDVVNTDFINRAVQFDELVQLMLQVSAAEKKNRLREKYTDELHQFLVEFGEFFTEFVESHSN